MLSSIFIGSLKIKKMIGNSTALDSFDNAKLFMASKEESKGQNVIGDINQLWDWMFKRQEECFPMWKFVQDIHVEGTFKDIHLEGCLARRDENETSTKLMKSIQSNQVDCNPFIYTILMDEPDQGLDIDNLEEVYSIVSYDKPQTQLIASIHNPVLINRLSKFGHINFIEMSNGYLKKVKNFMEG